MIAGEMTFSEMIKALRRKEIAILNCGWCHPPNATGAGKYWVCENIETRYQYWIPLPQGWV